MLANMRDTMAVVSEHTKKKQRLDDQPVGIPYQQQVFNSLINAADFAVGRGDLKVGDIELEVRVGMVTQLSRRWQPRTNKKTAQVVIEALRKADNIQFAAGIDEYYAHNVRQSLTKAGFAATTVPTQVVYCGSQFRYEKLPPDPSNPSGRPRISLEHKDKMFNQDVALFAHDYDLRFALAREEKIFALPHGFDPEAWTMQRTKKRITYQRILPGPDGHVPSNVAQQQKSPWRVDYTEVTIKHRDLEDSDQDGKEFEIEVELEGQAFHHWVSLAQARPGGPMGAPTGPMNSDPFLMFTNFLATELLFTLDNILPCHAEDIEAFETPLTQVTSEDLGHIVSGIHVLNRVVKGETAAIARSGGSLNKVANNLEFLGSMPINLYRRSFVNNVLEGDYYLTEKSDGVRYLLFTLPGGRPGTTTAVLLDRARAIHRFEGSDLLGDILGPGHVLDGEIVFHRLLQRSVFLVFDVLCWEEVSRVRDPFKSRYDLINEHIMPRYTQRLQAALRSDERIASSPQTCKLLLLLGKEFFRKDKISQLLQRSAGSSSGSSGGSGRGQPGGLHAAALQAMSGERVYLDLTPHDFLVPPLVLPTASGLPPSNPSGGRPSGTVFPRSCHPTDGIIFQPNSFYTFSRDYDLFKWKWSDLRSIDLGLLVDNTQRIDHAITHRNLHLVCLGPDDTRVDCTKRGDYNVGLGAFDTRRLLAEVDQLKRQRGHHATGTNGDSMAGIIAEVAYDIRLGMWRYLKLRRDKKEPNFIDTVLGVFTEQAEAMGQEELEYALLSATLGLEQDYETQMKKMLGKLLVWQRAGRK